MGDRRIKYPNDKAEFIKTLVKDDENKDGMFRIIVEVLCFAAALGVKNDRFVEMNSHVLAGTLSASEELMGQAQQGLMELWELITHQPAKDAHSGNQDTVTTEALSEIVGDIHRAA